MIRSVLTVLQVEKGMIESEVYGPAHEGDIEGVRQWLSAHPDHLNVMISDGYTLLHIACAFGHERLVSFLLDRMALVNVNATNSSAATPLHLAVAFRDEGVAFAIVEMLIANGAELNAKQADGTTALHHAIACQSTRLSNALIEAGADPHLKDGQNRTSSQYAKKLGVSLTSR